MFVSPDDRSTTYGHQITNCNSVKILSLHAVLSYNMISSTRDVFPTCPMFIDADGNTWICEIGTRELQLLCCALVYLSLIPVSRWVTTHFSRDRASGQTDIFSSAKFRIVISGSLTLQKSNETNRPCSHIPGQPSYTISITPNFSLS